MASISILDAAQQYHTWGANVNAIARGGKDPINKWAHLQEARQSLEELESYPWQRAGGVGIMNGPGGFHSFDTDAIKEKGIPPLVVSDEAIDALLYALQLPADYAWVWRGRSRAGWALAFCCDDPLPPGVLPAKKDEAGVAWGWPAKDSGADWHHLELRYARCQTIYPPSTGYAWRHGPPDEPPAVVPIHRVIDAFFTLCPPQPHTLGSIDRAVIDQIKQRFDQVAYAVKHFGGDTQREADGEIRVLGHGGMLINTDKGIWHCFGDEIGGDCFDLVAYAKYRITARNLNGKSDEVLAEAAGFAGVALPDRKPAQTVDATHPADDGESADDPRPAIDITALDLPTIMPQAWDAIATQNDPPILFRRAGELARLEATDSGALIVKTVDTRVMMGILARAAHWVRVTYARGARIEKEALPPAAVVDDCMVNTDPRIPAITRVVSAPTFADAETLLAAPGYHAAAHIYYDPKPGAVVPAVPDTPTRADLQKARSLLLNDLLVDFPFVSDADQVHAVALFLLPFVRELIGGPTPLHLIEAPTMGSGKGLLADALLLPALGDIPTPMAEASTDEEWGKKITSTLLGAPAVILIDNLNRMLAAGALAAALTTREFSDRILGKSEQVSLPVRCVWVATANNPTLSTEISRRCIRIRIDPRVDKPWQREGFRHPKLRTWVEANRGALIWAALVICRYGLQHGAAGPSLGSYEAWSDVLGRILGGAGFSGFLGNLDALYDRADVEGAAWRALIAAWWEKHQDSLVLGGELFPLVAAADADLLISGKDEIGRKKSFGKALARARDRVFSIEIDGEPTRLQVADGGSRQKARLWKLVPVEDRSIVCFRSFSPPHARENYISSGGEVRKNTQNTQNPYAVEEVDLPADLPDVPQQNQAQLMAERHRREQEAR